MSRGPRATSTDVDHPWAALAADRGGPEVVLIHGDGLVPAVARLESGAYLLKAGRVGGSEGEVGSIAITEEFVARVLDAALAGEVEWEQDPDFPYEVAAAVPGVDPPEDGLLMPRFLYRRAARVYEYAAIVPRVRDQVRRLVASAAA